MTCTSVSLLQGHLWGSGLLVWGNANISGEGSHMYGGAVFKLLNEYIEQNINST